VRFLGFAPEAERFSGFGRLLSILNMDTNIHQDIGGLNLAKSFSHAYLPPHERTCFCSTCFARGPFYKRNSAHRSRTFLLSSGPFTHNMRIFSRRTSHADRCDSYIGTPADLSLLRTENCFLLHAGLCPPHAKPFSSHGPFPVMCGPIPLVR